MKNFTSTKFEYTNTCTCQVYDVDNDTFIDTDYCFGDCWDYQMEDFAEITSDLFNKNETMWWRASGVRLWNGEVGGFFYADTPYSLIKGMTVNSEWIIRGEIFPDRIEYSLSHHDAPMGSSSVVVMVSEDERVSYGLY